jgi:hypothetical protein
MAWSKLTFGKHEGKTLAQVAFSDPDWFFWAYSEHVFSDKSKGIQDDAAKVFSRARKIKVPQTDPNDKRVVEYFIHPPTKKFGGFHIVSESQSPNIGSSPAFRKKVLDLSFARQIKGYDKTGCKILVGDMKEHLFGSRSARMSKNRCEDFFDDSTNFDL